MTRNLRLIAIVYVGFLCLSQAHADDRVPARTRAPHSERTYAKLPLSFTPNQGQCAPDVTFSSRGSGYAVALTRNGADLTLRDRTADKSRPTSDSVVRMRLLGSAEAPVTTGLGQLPGNANYLIGNDPRKWQTNIPTYARVNYTQVYPGVDLVYYGNQRQLEFDFVLQPGADPSAIMLGFHGDMGGRHLGLKIDRAGNLVDDGPSRAVLLRKPVVYQRSANKKQLVAARYVLTGDQEVSFRLGSYDKARPLVIDPTLAYSTLLHGSSNDEVTALAVNAAGEVYVTGLTESPTFPTTPGAISTGSMHGTAFVTRFNAAGTALLYSTYLGGVVGGTNSTGIAVDAAGDAYVAGFTLADDYPTTPGAYQTTVCKQCSPGFVSKLNPTGSAFVYSTLLNGTSLADATLVYGLAVDSTGHAYVTGYTLAADFPTTPGAFQTDPGSYAGRVQDAFLTKFNPSGSALIYSTLLGETDSEGDGLAVDSTGDAYIAGSTNNASFPTTPGAFSSIGQGFVTKFNPTATALLYSTRLRGSEQPRSLALDSAGNTYITGDSGTNDLPTTPNAFEKTACDMCDSPFVMKLNASGSALVYSTYFGNQANGWGNSIAIDHSGIAYITGFTNSSVFWTTRDAVQSAYAGDPSDAFFTQLNASGSAPLYSTFLGSYSGDSGTGIALDLAGNAYVGGYTFGGSGFFPNTPNSFQHDETNGAAGFISKFNFAAPPCSLDAHLLLNKDEYRVNEDNYVLDATFPNDLSPLTNPVTLSVGGYTITIPTGSFVLRGTAYEFHGEINNQPVSVTIQKKLQPSVGSGVTCGTDIYSLYAQVRSGNYGFIGDPVTVTFTIGPRTDTTQVKAQIVYRHYDP